MRNVFLLLPQGGVDEENRNMTEDGETKSTVCRKRRIDILLY